MDAITSSALEEICSTGTNGLALSHLWTKLAPSLSSVNLVLSPGVKASIWTNLLSTPNLEFHVRHKVLSPGDGTIQRLEDAEKSDLKIVANQSLRDVFIGLYDAQSAVANINDQQRRVLERLAVARANGILQSQLSKELGMGGKYIFYILKSLESRGLIMRHTAILRTKEAGGEGESRTSSSVMTNVIYSYRYEKQLGQQQTFEFTKEEQNSGGFENSSEIISQESLSGEYNQEDVVVKDYQPAMRAVCDKLEEAEGKVLVISDIKHSLGYHGAPSAHRAWRNICRRLKDACLVEEFEAKVNEKVQKCLRLLKPFPPESVEPQSLWSGKDKQGEELVSFGRRCLITDQVAELPIENQVFDMIDAEGHKGLTIKEVCRRLGINNKKYHNRFISMFSRFGMHVEAESDRKSISYRVWTPKHFNSDSVSASQFKEKNVDSGGEMSKLDGAERALPPLVGNFPSTSEDPHFKLRDRESETEFSQSDKGYVEADNVLSSLVDPQELSNEQDNSVPDSNLDLMILPNENSIAPSEPSATASLRSCKPESDKRYPCLSLTADGARREQRILERVQSEKFILRGELYKWLVSLEKSKGTTMDRKTIDRIVNKLQKQGHCKCIHLNVPNVSNCKRSRITQVVLHSSIKHLSPELITEIHDRMRSFEMETRSHGSSRRKDDGPIPVLNDVERIRNHIGSDVTGAKSEAMRANGFVLAKMVRAKLLHCFLWDYLHASVNCDSALLSKLTNDLNNPHSSCSMFSLEEAIKAIPLELFLQVAGSTQKFDDLIDKCKRGLRLLDLPLQEYRLLLDTQATGRLSVVIDILRRLKLIRLVNDGPGEDGVKVPHTVLTHAMELKPYIEEPLSSVPQSSSTVSRDLRPRIRHDFILSNREAVDEYWRTLEYCYAATDPSAAVHAFPGSSVHELFLFRSWASVRVMTAEQRAELLKRIVRDDDNAKLPYRECEKIAKDLNLTLEQVLRVYNDRRQKRLNRFQRDQNASRKRKRHLKVLSEDNECEVTGQLNNCTLQSNCAEQLMEERDHSSASLEELDPEGEYDNLVVHTEEAGRNEGGEGCPSTISQHEFAVMKATRRKRFLWTDELDRQLVILYARNRAILGAKFHRTDWSSLPDLPAPPNACGKRMASLNRSNDFRKALMRLCNLLGQQYTKHLHRIQEMPINNANDRTLVRSSREGSFHTNSCTVTQLDGENASENDRWDDFSCEPIKTVLEEVLQYKRINKLEASKRVGSCSKEWSNLNIGSRHETSVGSSKYAAHRSSSSSRRLHQRFMKLWNDGGHICGHICESLAVSNAVELLKLVFLNSSTAPEVPRLLAESLRRYSQHDLFSAFSYLRERKIMVGGVGGQPFALSQNFLHDISKSRFPANTGKRVARFSRWLHEWEKDLDKEEIVLNDDLQCGDVMYLFGLISSSSLMILPRLPEEGVGEVEDLRNLKRKADENESDDGSHSKKMKSMSEGEVVSRREKGFPGITVSAHRTTLLRTSAMELAKDVSFDDANTIIERSDIDSSMLFQTESTSSLAECTKEIFSSADTIEISGVANGSLWDSMSSYAEKVFLTSTDTEQGNFISPSILKAAYSAIQRAGDQGLSSEEILDVLNKPGGNVLEILLEVLQLFGLAMKVNAFDSVRVVDSLYRPKYFLTSIAGSCQDIKQQSSAEPLRRVQEGHFISYSMDDGICGDSYMRDSIRNTDHMHKVTILNLPQEADVDLTEAQKNNAHGGPMEGEVNLPRGTYSGECSNSLSGETCMPIVPWINGDGTFNRLVYRGLVRRVLGIVMLNPGILEDDILCQLDVINPQSCRKLLDLMVLDKHLIVRKMCQTVGCDPPGILGSLLSTHMRESKLGFREHFFANPMSASLL